MTAQHTIAASFTLDGAGLHSGRRCRVTVRPAVADFGWRIANPATPRLARAMTWANRVPSVMSTSIALDQGRAVRTVEHLMASLAALAIDNVLIEVDGPEIPILDGSARPWCEALRGAGRIAQNVERRAIRIVRPFQLWREGGFLRAEPADAPAIDLTYDLLPAFDVMRWTGPLDGATFVSELSSARSFGRVNVRRMLGRPPPPLPWPVRGPQHPHAPDAALLEANHPHPMPEAAEAGRGAPLPMLRGARPGRVTLVVGRAILPYRRYRDEPVRHVALDLIGDLALAGAPILGRIVTHNPSHEKTFLFVAALMRDRSAWTWTHDAT